jgi:3',5'-cyclic AMP phosphodiesterase CpdA
MRPEMSLLLHLSDLHLGPQASTPVGDYKVEAIPHGDRQNRIGLFRQTLNALTTMLAASGEALDAVIITGDVTTYGDPAGFNQLPNLLSALGSSLPPPDHILVATGNHDVRWRTPPGSATRYEAFATLRGFGYVTPLLEGLDRNGSSPAPNPVLVGRDYVIALMNSADMCGVEEPLSPQAESELEALGHESSELVAEVRRLRLYDMPRISQWQLSRVGDILRGISAAESRIRIAALHHHLLPVRSDEEAKPFESLTNLGEVTAFFVDSAIDLVIHGHKHFPAVIDVPSIARGHAVTRHHTVISSCATVGGGVGAGGEIARLIRINSDLPVRRSFSIESVPAVSAGASLASPTATVYQSGPPRPEGAAFTQLVGGTATDVHEQILQLSEVVDGQPISGLICTVEDGLSCLRLPESYPTDVPNPRESWFEGTVAWWQDSQVEAGKPFTHGQRLRRWTPEVDQLRAAIDALKGDPTTSRAVAVLVDPGSDRIADHRVEFPSFVLIHLRVIGDALECTAFFRKQEMRYWWAINVGEVAHLQREALSMLADRYGHLRAGAIRTIANEAVFSASLPKVNVPQIDRIAWRDPSAIWVMALAVADVDMPGRRERIRELESVAGDWLSPAVPMPRDGAAVPRRGLRALHEALSVLAATYENQTANDAAAILREMHESSQIFGTQQQEGTGFQEYTIWRERQLELLRRLSKLLAADLDAGRA